MKIRGRFIGILAVLGLLIALVPLATAGAVAGTVTLDGGEMGQFFSDRPGENVITIEVKDQDLSPVRIGTARSIAAPGASGADLATYYVSGEKDETDKLHGQPGNGPCTVSIDPDGTGDLTAVSIKVYANACPGGSDSVMAVSSTTGSVTSPISTAEATAATIRLVANQTNPVDDEAYEDGDFSSVDNADWNTVFGTTGVTYTLQDLPTSHSRIAYEVTLSEIARDRQAVTSSSEEGVGEIRANDIMSVVVNGVPVTNSARDTGTEGDFTDTGDVSPPSSGAYFMVDELTAGPVAEGVTPGGGIEQVTLHRITPQASADNVVITYRVTEFSFTNSGSTPLTLEGTKVKYNSDDSPDSRPYFGATSEVGADGASGTTISYNAVTGGSYTVVTFGYNFTDNPKKLVTLSSGSAGNITLDAEETGAGNSIFQIKVAIFHPDDYLKIQTQTNNRLNDKGADCTGTPPAEGEKFEVSINELNCTNGLTDAGVTGSGTLDERLTIAATGDGDTGLGLAGDGKASDLLKKLIPGRDGDTINVSYADINPATTVTKSAKVDMMAPTVTLVSPANNYYTSDRVVTLSAEVTDSGAGINQGDLSIATSSGGDFDTSGVTLGSSVVSPITGGYRVTNVPSGQITEGGKHWFVRVKDKVGNLPIMDDTTTDDVIEAPKGTAGYPGGEAGNPFKFTVDTRAPTLSTGITGMYLKNPGVISGDADDKETEKEGNAQWVRVNFSLGEGTAPLDPATVSANDFRVDDQEPTDAIVNARTHGETDKGSAVYLQVGQLDTDARPEVVLSGEIRDKAGNIRSDGRVATLNDGLAPKLTVTASADIHASEITITVSSSERLRSNPSVGTTTTKPVKGYNAYYFSADGVAADGKPHHLDGLP